MKGAKPGEERGAFERTRTALVSAVAACNADAPPPDGVRIAGQSRHR